MLKIINSSDCLPKTFYVGDNTMVGELSKRLISMGYTKVDRIDHLGEFSIKGDTIDIPCDNNFAYRIMFFGDEIEAIRVVKLGNFATVEKLKSCDIYPIGNGGNIKHFTKIINIDGQEIKTEFLLNMDFVGTYIIIKPQSKLTLKKAISTSSPYITKFRGDTKIGSLIWHDKYGIGRFAGVKKMALGNTTHKYVMLQYDRKAIVYVPFHQLNLLYNYHGKAKRLDRV